MLDRERADFDHALALLQESFGAQVVAVQLPIGKEHEFSGVVDLLTMKAHTYTGGKASVGDIPAELADAAAAAREKLIDAVASTNDDLAEKYLMEEEITAAELNAAFAAAVAAAQLFPVACASATANIAVDHIFDVLALALSPVDVTHPKAMQGDAEVELDCDPSMPAVAFVFKTLADPFSGHVNVFRVFQGTMSSDSQAVIARDGHKERLGQILKTMGKESKASGNLVAGDIGAIAKLKDVVTGDTLCTDAQVVSFPAIDFPAPLMSFAITAKSKGEEDKVITALRRLSEEDPMLEVHHDDQTGEMIVGGMSQVHVEVSLERMKRRFGAEVELKPLACRTARPSRAPSTRRQAQEANRRARPVRAWIKVCPSRAKTGYEYVNKIVGGAIPKQWIPSVDKGIQKALGRGVLAGYPTVDIKVECIDGKYHDVDGSSEMSFQIAGSKGFKAAMREGQSRPSRAHHGNGSHGPRGRHGRHHGQPQQPSRPRARHHAARPQQRGRAPRSRSRRCSPTRPTSRP